MEADLRKFIADFWAEPISSTRRETREISELGPCVFGFLNSRAEESVSLVIINKRMTFIWKSLKAASNSFWNDEWIADRRLEMIYDKI